MSKIDFYPDYIGEIVQEQIENGIKWDWLFRFCEYDLRGNLSAVITEWKASEHNLGPMDIEGNYIAYAVKRYPYPTCVEITPLGETHPEICPPAKYWCTEEHEGPREEAERRREVLWTDGWPLPHRFMVRGLLRAAGLTAEAGAALISSSNRSMGRYMTGALRMPWAQYHYLRIRAGLDPKFRPAKNG